MVKHETLPKGTLLTALASKYGYRTLNIVPALSLSDTFVGLGHSTCEGKDLRWDHDNQANQGERYGRYAR